MTNKRQIKKFINENCLDLVFVTFIESCTEDNTKAEEYEKLIGEIAELRSQALTAASVSFDKTPKSFENKKEYNKARRAYYKQAYSKFTAEYIERMQKIVDKINALLKGK